MTAIDPVALTQALIRRPSVTPADAGAMDVVQQALDELGFNCRRMKFGEIENLYARHGLQGPNLCFAGHTDVVPVGEAGAWSVDPFEARIQDGVLIGRGATDMKSAIAAFIAAAEGALAAGEVRGSLSLLITGDEEGHATHGTKAVVAALAAEGEKLDHCLVGEPTSSAEFGDMIKIGRRGTANFEIVVQGRQGHVAYPDRAANPVPMLVHILSELLALKLDDGYQNFQPSNLEVTTIDVGNRATNVIPSRATAKLNIRFNPTHSGDGLIERISDVVDRATKQWVERRCERSPQAFNDFLVTLDPRVGGEAFLTEPGPFVAVVAEAVEAVAGRKPELSTTGGTSDARFIRALCPVVELGLVGATMHAVDERTPVADIRQLTDVYRRLIRRYFEQFSPAVSA